MNAPAKNRSGERGAWIAAALGAGGVLWLLRSHGADLLDAWLAQYNYWIGIGVGSVGLRAMLMLGGADLAVPLALPLAAAMRLLLPLALLFLPIAIGIESLYPWERTHAAHTWYLDKAFFLLRAFVYFCAWLGGATLLRRNGAAAGALLLVILLLTTTFAAFDWLMSLTPAWHSAVFGLRWFVDGLLSAMAIAVFVEARRDGRAGNAGLRIDAGTLLFALNLGWLYLLFVEYLTIWSGDLPSEILWYLPRVDGAWRYASIVLLATHVVAALLLLSRALKRDPRALAATALLIAFAQWLEAMWMVLPSLRPLDATPHWSDAATLLAISGICIAIFLGSLRRATPTERHV